MLDVLHVRHFADVHLVALDVIHVVVLSVLGGVLADNAFDGVLVPVQFVVGVVVVADVVPALVAVNSAV